MVGLADHPLLQGSGEDQGLEGGAGLIGVVEGLVAPLGILRVLKGFGIGLVVGAGVVPHRLHVAGQH